MRADVVTRDEPSARLLVGRSHHRVHAIAKPASGCHRRADSALRDIVKVSPALSLGTFVPYFLDGLSYLGMLTLLATYLAQNVALGMCGQAY